MKRKKAIVIPKLSKAELEAKRKMLANYKIPKDWLLDDEFVAKANVKVYPPISEEERIKLMINAGAPELCSSFVACHPEHSRIIDDSGTYRDDYGKNYDYDESDRYLD